MDIFQLHPSPLERTGWRRRRETGNSANQTMYGRYRRSVEIRGWSRGMNRNDPVYLSSPTPRHPSVSLPRRLPASYLNLARWRHKSNMLLLDFYKRRLFSLLRHSHLVPCALFSPSCSPFLPLLSPPSPSFLSHLADYLGISTSTTPERSSRDWTGTFVVLGVLTSNFPILSSFPSRFLYGFCFLPRIYPLCLKSWPTSYLYRISVSLTRR